MAHGNIWFLWLNFGSYDLMQGRSQKEKRIWTAKSFEN